MSVLPVGFGSALGGYNIERSLRFNSADSAYLNRTPASAGNRKTWTWSGWVKRSALSSSTNIGILEGNAGATDLTAFRFTADALGVQDYSNSGGYILLWNTSAVFRDPSAWYHIVLAYDTTQASSSNAVKIYVNGVQQTATFTAVSGAYVQNRDSYINATNVQRIGVYDGLANYLNGYMTEINFIDGQALTPSSFGQTNAATGVWEPIPYTGTYGTNGFYLNFSDNSNTTAATLGKDYSGNGNNWTPNNFSVTAGAGNDSLVDSPTSYGTDTGVGGEVRGNYATLNPLAKSSVGTLDNGNLQWTSGNSGGGTAGNGTRASIGMNVGKWYTEVTRLDTVFWSYPGISNETHLTSIYNGGDANSWSIDASGQKVTNNSSSAYGSATWAANDIINIAYDADNGELYFGKNGTWLNSGNPVTRTNPAFTSLSGTLFFTVGFSANSTSASSVVFNFGQRPFAYTPPAGFRSLCTTNLPATAIGFGLTNQGDDYFNAVTYTGNGTGQTISTVGFQPDLVWVKNRNAAGNNHNLQDSVRGFSVALSSSLTNADSAASQAVSGVTSTGFTLGNNSNGYSVNENTYTYVAWNWKANGTGVTNTAGSITSTVSANTTAGFSIVTYTGNGVDGATTGHGLGAVPNMVIVKRRDVISDWNTKHSSLSSNNVVFLNSTSAQQTPGSGYTGDLNSSTTITFRNGGSAITNVNGSGSTYVAYCFAAVPGYSAFGSYTGNGSADGPFVYTGFRPRYVLIKDSTNSATEWGIADTVRDTDNPINLILQAESSAAEATATNRLDILSNGFKIRNTGFMNTNNAKIIYMAFAETPAKFSLAR